MIGLRSTACSYLPVKVRSSQERNRMRRAKASPLLLRTMREAFVLRRGRVVERITNSGIQDGCLDLQLLHGRDVGGLNVVLVLLDLGLELVQRDLVVLNDNVELELLDAEADSDELRATPHETVLLDGKDVLLELLHVRLVVW